MRALQLTVARQARFHKRSSCRSLLYQSRVFRERRDIGLDRVIDTLTVVSSLELGHESFALDCPTSPSGKSPSR